MTDPDHDRALSRQGRRAALLMAGTAVFWILATAIGAEYGWPTRVRALADLVALAGFGLALWLTFRLWRQRQDDKR
jgi:threonine/homoserine/homoserine lactone efflux protein